MIRCLMLCVLTLSAPISTQAAETLSILASRDLGGDIARVLGVGTVADGLRQSGSPTVLVDVGGALSPSEAAFTHRRKGSLTVDAMNSAGYAAWFLSGRDLAWADHLTRFLRRTDFPVLAANAHRPETGRHLFQIQPFTVVRVASVRIGLVGLTESAPGTLSSDPLAAATYYVDLVRDRCDLVIVAATAPTEVLRSIAGVGGVDLVLSPNAADTEQTSSGGWVAPVGPTPGLWGLDVTHESGVVSAVVSRQIDVPAIEGEPVQAMLQGWTAEIEGEPVSLGTVMGTSEGGFQAALTSPLGYLVADLMQASAGTDAALVRIQHFPDDFKTGPITVFDLFKAYSLPYTVGVARLKGADLMRFLDLTDGELQFYPAGIQVVYGATEAGVGIIEARIGEGAIDPRVDYTVAVEAGAFNASVAPRDTGVRIRDLFGRHLRTSETIRGVVDGRIQRR